MRALGLAALLALAPAAALAQPGPAPEREFSTDRPDTTESPYTVPPGRLQVETTGVGWSRSGKDSDGVRTTTWEVGTTELRIGLTPRLEANVFFQPYGRNTFSDGKPAEEGTGDVTLRAKYNFWGADGVKEKGDTAFGIIPLVDIPTDRKNGIGSAGVGGGVILPLDVSFGGRFSLGANVGVVARREDLDKGYAAVVLSSASLSIDWTEKLGTYHEIALELNKGDKEGDVANYNTGVTYKLADNLQLDAGVSIGLTRAADRITTFFGVSKRF